jgi:hypothetical protein
MTFATEYWRERTPAVCEMPQAVTLRDYVAGLRAAGIDVFDGKHGSYWVASADRVVRRLPAFDLSVADQAEVDRALAATGGLIASYVMEPTSGHPANSSLYLCDDHNYSLRQRASAMRRNVRRAMRELSISLLSPGDVMAHGERAFCDTRRRNGLDDGTRAGFRGYFRQTLSRPGRACLGAWKNGQLAAFVTIARVDDWVEVVGSFSMSSMLRYRPNDALLFTTLSHYLSRPDCRLVSYGLSSVQPDCSPGLHRFKLKVGFRPKRVRRAFLLHPSLRPFANRLSLTAAYAALSTALRVQPRDRRLKALTGVFACMLGGRSRRHDGVTADGPEQFATT